MVPPATTRPGAVVQAYGCAAALEYLQLYAAPGFRFVCPGYALGADALTCIDYPGVCPGEKLIIIHDPCPVAYMNEASNSWVIQDLLDVPIDQYGPSCPR